jgi:hypothetical protein
MSKLSGEAQSLGGKPGLADAGEPAQHHSPQVGTGERGGDVPQFLVASAEGPAGPECRPPALGPELHG